MRRRVSIISRCLFCNACSGHPVANCCSGCFAALPHIASACGRCGLPVPAPTTLCGNCVLSPPPLQSVIAPFTYQPPLDAVVNRLKHRRDPFVLPLLVHAMVERIEKTGAPLPDLVIPVPMHWTRYLARGFNQAELLARALARQMQLPCRTRLTYRTKRTRRQQQLSAEQRRSNLRDSFQCKEQLDGTRVALVDDVATSLSTLLELADTLRAAGAGEIQCWVAARTPPGRAR